MGFVDKVKNFFYEDVDDDEIELKPDKPKKEKIVKEKEERKPLFRREPEYEETQKIDIEYEEDKTNSDLSERELFRAERTFNFPVDIDEDEEKEATSSFTEQEKDEFFGPTSRLRFDEEKRENNESSKPTKFRPSPVISPVYGILDKDYNVDDVEEINKGDDHSLNKKIADYDTVRNKAYKEMDDELEKTLNKSKSIFYNLDEKETKEDINISYGEDEVEAKEVEIPETRAKKNKNVVEESDGEVKADTDDLFNLLDNVTTEEYDDDDE